MLGKSLMEEFAGRPIRANILITHFHWDHIQGLPFFVPLYNQANQFHIYSYRPREAPLEETLGGQMTQPYFPVDMTAMRAQRCYTEVSTEAFQLDDFRVQPARLNHPQGCLCFRIENNGKSVVFATDTEPGNPSCDRARVEPPTERRDHDRQRREIGERHRENARLRADHEQERCGASRSDRDDESVQHHERCPALVCG